MQVLCCCNPSNELGHAPAGLPFPVREWQDEDGNAGIAYVSHGVDWDAVPGFEANKRGKKRRKTPRRTWRER